MLFCSDIMYYIFFKLITAFTVFNGACFPHFLYFCKTKNIPIDTESVNPIVAHLLHHSQTLMRIDCDQLMGNLSVCLCESIHFHLIKCHIFDVCMCLCLSLSINQKSLDLCSVFWGRIAVLLREERSS